MIDQADQPWLAGMVVLRRQLTFSSITSPIYYCQEPLSALLGCCLIDFILQDERRRWRRIKPRMPMMNQGRPHD